jgi:polyisoprenoid-binding protein YceI
VKPQTTPPRNFRRLAIIGGVIALVAIAAVAGFIIYTGVGTSSPHSGPVVAATLAPNANATTFTIQQSGSKASFTTTEVLFGANNTVVGTTDQVAGQIQVDRNDPSQSKVGEIKVDMSTLATDNNLRNDTLHNRILETGTPANQYAIFTETAITGMPSTVSTGQTVTFAILGNLTIHGVTRPATWAAQVTLDSQTRLSGKATTKVNYPDYNITIPNVPGVANVGQTITLELDFTATSA